MSRVGRGHRAKRRRVVGSWVGGVCLVVDDLEIVTCLAWARRALHRIVAEFPRRAPTMASVSAWDSARGATAKRPSAKDRLGLRSAGRRDAE